MSKDPAFLFYYQDFMWGTRYFTPEQRGLYVELMCEQADSSNGSIPEEHMNKICKSCDEHTKNTVISKFKKDSNGFYNERLRDILFKRRAYSESRSKNRKGLKIDIQQPDNLLITHDKHMGNRNRNTNESNRRPKCENLTFKDYDIECDKALKPAVDEWLAYKQERKEPYKERGLKAFIKELTELSAGDGAIALKIINRSMANNWAGIFELKNNNNADPDKRHESDFD